MEWYVVAALATAVGNLLSAAVVWLIRKIGN
jgi:hypothetical protein